MKEKNTQDNRTQIAAQFHRASVWFWTQNGLRWRYTDIFFQTVWAKATTKTEIKLSSLSCPCETFPQSNYFEACLVSLLWKWKNLKDPGKQNKQRNNNNKTCVYMKLPKLSWTGLQGRQPDSSNHSGTTDINIQKDSKPNNKTPAHIHFLRDRRTILSTNASGNNFQQKLGPARLFRCLMLRLPITRPTKRNKLQEPTVPFRPVSSIM